MTTTHHTRIPSVLRDLADVLEGIGAESETDPTPCSQFTVTDLRNHVVQWITAFAEGLDDPGGQCPTDTVDVEGDGSDQVRVHAARIDASLSSPPPMLYIGPDGMPTEMALGMILAEYIVHGWDLAVSTGQTWTPNDDDVDAALDFMSSALTPDAQGPGKDFASRVPVAETAPTLDQLLGVTGRNPQWSR